MLTWPPDLKSLTARGLRRITVVAALVAGATVVVPGVRTASGAEALVRAMASAHGQGYFFEIGERRATFLGGMRGVLYIESGPDALDGASLSCTSSYEFDRLQPTVTAAGHCTIAKGADDKVYARWTCSGTLGWGCRGRLTIDSGTGRFASITGEGEIVVRAGFAEFTEPPKQPGASAGPAVAREQHDILVIMPALRYRLP